MTDKDSKSDGLVTKLTGLFALYVVYVFLSGWTFFDYYFREFGIDPRWLDLPAQEILVKGFTILFTGGYWLWLIYPIMIVGPVVIDEKTATLRNRTATRFAVPLLLIAALVGVYFASRQAGMAEASIDKSRDTGLPLITFTRKPSAETPTNTARDFTGHVLAFRNGIYYLHDVSPVGNPSAHNIALCVYRIEDLTDIQVVEH